MGIIKDLQRILWHELGHLCIDILDSEANPDFFIDSLRVSYYKIAISDHKWGGAVKTLPALKWEVLVEDTEKTSFAMLSLISGCIFQTVFLKEFLHDKVDFKDCFFLQQKCAGQGDYFSFYSITSQLRKKHGRKEDFIKFSEIELFSVYYKLIVDNQFFLAQLNELIVKYRDRIFETYQQSENKDEFHYYFIDNELESLKEEIYKIMLETSFKDIIMDLKELLKGKMIA